MKRNFKRQLAVFITSFIITACVILFSVSSMVVEKNTLGMLGESISRPFALDFKDKVATLTVNDKDYDFSYDTASDVLKSKSSILIVTLLLVL